MADYLAYDSADDNAALNDRYEKIPTPANGEELESSDDEDLLPKLPESDDEDDISETESEEEKNKKEANNGNKLLDPDFDPLQSWDKLAGAERKLNDLQELLSQDPDVQRLWKEQAGEISEVSDDNDDEEESEESEGEESKRKRRKRSDDDDDDDNDDEDEELGDILSSGEESDEPIKQSEPPTPVSLDAENGEEEDDDDDEDEGSDFSLGDIATEPEDEEQENEEEQTAETPAKISGEDNEEDGEEEDGEENDAEDDDGDEKPKQYRKIPKDDDSDSTEYETITEEDEPEQEAVIEEPDNEVEEEEIEVEPPPPDPYGYTELHTNIEHIEEFDDDFDNEFRKRYKSSAMSSLDESDPGLGDCDVPKHSIEGNRHLSVVVANKTGVTSKKQQKRKRISVIKRPNQADISNLKTTETNATDDKSKQHTNQRTSKQENYVIDLDVYNYDNYPTYDEQANETRPEPKDNKQKESVNKNKSRKKKKKLPSRKLLEKCYARVNPWYKDVLKKPETDYPSSRIPSYKIIARARDIKEKTVNTALNSILQQTFKAIDDIERKRLRKEAEHHSRYIVMELADNVVGEIEEFQQRDAVRFAIEVLLDQWEGHVYKTKKTIVEDKLDVLSETIVTNAIKKSATEVGNEDRVASLAVRDALAVSMNDLGKSQNQIQRILYKMFSEYDFPDYNFKSGKATRIKQKRHRQRKELDVYLRERAKQMNAPFGEELSRVDKQNNTRKRRRRQKLNEIKEKDTTHSPPAGNNIEEQNIVSNGEQSVADQNAAHSPFFISPEHSENESEAKLYELYDAKEPIKIADLADVVERSRRRSNALDAWCNEDKKILHQLRSENKTWNDIVDEREIKTLEENGGKEETKKDLNAMYAESSEEENAGSDTDGDPTNDEKIMPDLKKIVDEALYNKSAPIVVVPVPVGRRRERIGRPDSAIGSDKEGGVPRTRKTAVFQKNPTTPPPPISRNDTGISSTIVDDQSVEHKMYVAEVLKGNTLENKMSSNDVIELIPKLDRDQYLQEWLSNGVKSNNELNMKRIPTPPEQPKNKKVRRYHLKRPDTANSIASIRDTVPIEDGVYKKFQGRLNSAKSVRSNGGRPESAKSIYTERSSLHSSNDNLTSESENNIESDEEDKNKTRNRGNQKFVKRNTKIRFRQKQQQKPQQSDEITKIHEEQEMAAWNFFSRQRRELRLLQQTIEERGRPELLSDVVLPQKELNDEERAAIHNRYTHIEINGMFDDSEEELELLQLADRKGSNSECSDKEGEQNRLSIEPPSTPWKRIKGRPLTPDSMDSDEELTKLKDKFFKEYQKKQNGGNAKPDRVWKEFLRKKSTSLPPPPKLGWQPTPGLINWKNAHADVRKEKRRKNSDGDVTTNLKRNLFNQLQIVVNREEKEKATSNRRLLTRRRTLHNENISITKVEKREKLLPGKSSKEIGNLSPRSTRSVPSYAKATKAAQLKTQETRLPKIQTTTKSTTTSKKSTKGSKTKR